MPHSNTQDDWYEGMFIPKGSMIVLPIYAVNRLESNGYKDPAVYNPDRWIGQTRIAAELAGLADYENRDKWPYFPFDVVPGTDSRVHITTATEQEGVFVPACTWRRGPCGV